MAISYKGFYKKETSKNFVMPTDLSPVSFQNNEAVLYFPKNKHTKWFWGIGIIKAVKRETKYDDITILFNKLLSKKHYEKHLFAFSTNARKQVATLKADEYCMVFGSCLNEKTLYKVEVFFPSFVPTAFDLKNNDYETLPETYEGEEEELDLIDILNGKG